jgi:predicted permease
MNEISIITPIAAVIFFGWFFTSRGIIPQETFRHNNKILYWLSIPAAGIHVFPRALDVTLKVLGDIGTGMALLAVGAGLDFRSAPAVLRKTWRDSFIKLIVQPALVWACLLLWPVGNLMVQVVVFVCAMPVAVNSLVVAQGMGMDDQYASELIAVTTLFSAITLPVWIRVLGI